MASIDVPEIQIKQVVFTLTGTSPLIMHRWSEKAKEQMRAKQTQAATQKKAPKVATEDFDAATYFISKKPERWGFPAVAFKAACVDAAVALGEKKTETRRAFHVIQDVTTPDGELVEIFAAERTMREDMVRITMTTDMRYRPEFRGWSANLRIAFDSRQINIAKLHNLLDQAGFSTGIGEWRPERDGNFGMFRVAAVGTPVDDSVRASDAPAEVTTATKAKAKV